MTAVCLMTYVLSVDGPTSLEAMVEKGNRTITVPVAQIVAGDGRRPLSDAKVSELAKSICAVGLLSPIVVALRGRQSAKEECRLVAGPHCLKAMKLLGIVDAPCTILGRDDDLPVELVEIEENISRNDPTPAEDALLTGRRRKIFRILAAQGATLSQDETRPDTTVKLVGGHACFDAPRSKTALGRCQKRKFFNVLPSN